MKPASRVQSSCLPGALPRISAPRYFLGSATTPCGSCFLIWRESYMHLAPTGLSPFPPEKSIWIYASHEFHRGSLSTLDLTCMVTHSDSSTFCNQLSIVVRICNATITFAPRDFPPSLSAFILDRIRNRTRLQSIDRRRNADPARMV
jgi:hypothetical protein